MSEKINELGRRIDNYYAERNAERKAETSENEDALLDVGDIISDFDERISALEEKEE